MGGPHGIGSIGSNKNTILEEVNNEVNTYRSGIHKDKNHSFAIGTSNNAPYIVENTNYSKGGIINIKPTNLTQGKLVLPKIK